MLQDNSNKVFEKKSTVASWDQDYYNETSEYFYDNCVVKMLQQMHIAPGEKVLDAGCGPGVHSVRVARAGHPVCAIDFSQTMLGEANKRVSAAGLEKLVEFKQEDLTHLSFPSNSFKYAFSWGVIIHIRNVESALSELARIITPGGRLALYINNADAVDLKLERLARSLLSKPQSARESLPLGVGGWYTMHGERLWVWHFDIPKLAEYLDKQGLRLVHRSCGELSEFQRRFAGTLRQTLLKFNNFAFRREFPAKWANGNLLIFEKTTS
jgi:ubiquinone/menaquinone biosynthesis C-methylase UbiE